MRALIASSRCGSATPGSPTWTGSARPSAATVREPRPDRGRIEAQLGRHVAREGRLRPERLEQRRVGDERVALRVARDPDLGQRVADLGHLPQQRQPVREVARLLGVAAHDERPIDAGALQPGDQLGEVGAVADHPRRQMRHGAEPERLELLAQRDRGLDALGRRGRHRHRRAGRQERRLLERVLQRHELERRRAQDRGERGGLGRRQRGPAAEQHAVRPPSPASTPCAGS